MEGEKDNCISFWDISITRDRTGKLDTKIYRKPIHSERYLYFKSKYLLEHESAVIDVLTHRVNSLIRDENKKPMELKHIQNVFFYFKRLSKLAVKPKIKNQIRSSICNYRNSQYCRNLGYGDTFLCFKAFG